MSPTAKIVLWTVLAIIVITWVSMALAHDLWISKEGKRNAAGEWCCGEGDCFALPPDKVKAIAGGYAIIGGVASSDVPLIEFVPMGEVQPSMDGQYWRCQRPDGSRRCFFAPPQSY